MRKISMKIISAILSCSFLIAVIIGGISIYKSTTEIKKEVNEKLFTTTENNALKFNMLFL